ncbi:MAG: hypothetical protein BWZ07_02749 [Alphaproteobacteria bacterium ADurb.BinA280]|nr:MAG: hypothetical protein BWZ07_02749 [Alphaproteobacteria bacterium ADurb.BinA280]
MAEGKQTADVARDGRTLTSVEPRQAINGGQMIGIEAVLDAQQQRHPRQGSQFRPHDCTLPVRRIFNSSYAMRMPCQRLVMTVRQMHARSRFRCWV